ncbi:MAG: 3-hydroxyacyl-CoA dehydrogenase [Candidatus Jordarchaeales archaeon]
MGEVGRVAVIGAGTMGSDVSFLFALSGCEVVVNDVSERALNKLRAKFEKNIEELQREDVVKEDVETVWERVTTTTNLDDVKDVDFVFEAVNEDLELKRKVFRRLDELPRSVVLATNTSSLTVTEIAEGLRGAERVGGMHFSNPPIIMPLVEVVKGRETSEETLEVISRVAERLGKTPVIVRIDMRGFILNRILLSAGAEGLWAISRGEAAAEELDGSIKAMGFPIGLAEAVDIIGVDIVMAVSRNLREAYGDRFMLPMSMLEEMARKGRLGKKAGAGFYDWSEGKPRISEGIQGAYDVTRIVAVAANEAFWIMSDGVAEPETIDRVVKLGMLSPVGICELADALGLDTLAKTLHEVYKKYGLELYRLCPLFEDYVKHGRKGRSVGKGFYEY